MRVAAFGWCAVSTRTQEHATLWVCEDCYATANGLDDDITAPDREPLSLIGGDAEVTSGLVQNEHDPACTVYVLGWMGDECECERRTFSWSPCQGCGSTLGGSREALTVWSAS